jgi:hypothetical protein
MSTWASRGQKDKYNRNRVLARKIRRKKLLMLYGGQCVCCGEWRYEFLGIDHIDGGGNKEREYKGPDKIFREIEKDGLSDKYRVLCNNCNMSIGFYGYCPHQISNDRDFNMAVIV